MNETVLMEKVYQNLNSLYKGNQFFYVVKGKCASNTLELIESFRYFGTYVFANVLATYEENFYKAIEIFLSQMTPAAAFLWIENPSDPSHKWRYQIINCFKKDVNEWVLSQFSQLKFNSYRLRLFGSLKVSCQDGQMQFSSTKEEDYSFSFWFSNIEGIPKNNSITLSFESGSVGQLLFDTVISGNGKEDIFEKMDAGIKYATVIDEEGTLAVRQGFVGIVFCPVLRTTQPVYLKACINPLYLCDVNHSYFKLGEDHQNLVLDSSLMNISGYSQKVKVCEDAKLVFEKAPILLSYDVKNDSFISRQELYLGLAGSFEFTSSQTHLLCGLTGTEFIDISQAESLKIEFVPQQNCFIKNEVKNVLATGSWIKFPQNTKYYSQPEIAPLYAVNDKQMLRAVEIPTMVFSNLGQTLPIALYKNAQVNLGKKQELTQFETQLYNLRYGKIKREVSLLEKGKHLSLTQGERLSVTSQGLMAAIDQTGEYSWFGIAQTEESQGIPNIRFQNLKSTFKLALQDKNLFLYRDNAASFLEEAKPVAPFCVSVEDWQFLLNTKDWKTDAKENNTALIIKFVKEKSIKDLLSGTPIFDKAVEKAYDDNKNIYPDYEHFITCMENPNFQGVVFLNPCVSVAKLPKEIELLLKNIKQNDFYAHHLILEGNKVLQSDTGSLVMEQTNIYGLIDYSNNSEIVYDESMPNYSFVTTKLAVKIVSSVIAEFSSVSEIMIANLYGAACTKLNTNSGNCMILDGRRQNKSGEIEYVFTLRELGVYGLLGSGISEINIQKVLLSVDNASGKSGVLSMDGQMRFNLMAEADLSSYSELFFSSMQLIIPADNQIFMNYDRVSLALENSTLREGSFGKRFACDLDKIMYSESETPEDLGYVNITGPLRQGKLVKPWTAQVWTLKLGNLGGLSSEGEIGIKLLLAWSNSQEKPSYYLGIALPSIAKGFDLQGIIKLGFQSTELLANERDGTLNYTLRLHNYTLRLLFITLPPGSNDLFIFSDGKKVGWYGAYIGGDSSGTM